jgi:hypothetical protein
MSEELLVEGYKMHEGRDTTVYYSAKLTNDSDLPSFIKFNTETREFKAEPMTTEDIGSFEIKIICQMDKLIHEENTWTLFVTEAPNAFIVDTNSAPTWSFTG